MGKTTKTGKPVKVAKRRPFELLLGEHEGAYSKARWCISPETTKKLSERGVLERAKMLIEVVNDGVTTKRYLLPLTQEGCTVAYSRSGKSAVYGVIVWAYGEHSHDAYMELMDTTSNGRYRTSLLDSMGRIRDFDFGHNGFFDHVETVEVEVDKNCFAKPMSRFTKAILAKWDARNPFDQCERRGDMIVAVPMTILAIPFAYIVKILGVVLLGLIGLFRGIDWSMLWHPMERRSLGRMFSDIRDPWWFCDDRGNPRSDNGQWYMMVWSPYLIFLGGLIVFIISNVHYTNGEIVQDFLGWGWWFCLAVSAMAFTAVVLVGFLICGLIVVVPPVLRGLAVGLRWFLNFLHLPTLAKKISVKTKEQRKTRAAKKEKERVGRVEEALLAMECPIPLAGGASLRAIPRVHKTRMERLRLRRDEMKPGVCLPYER